MARKYPFGAPTWGHGRLRSKVVASIEERSGHWRVYWRLGGRDGRKQSTTWQSRGNAERAKQIADAHRNRITAEEVYASVIGATYTGPADPPAPKLPTVAEWAEVWLAAKTRITPGQRARYRAQLDNEILPRIGHLRLDEVDGSAIANLLTQLRVGRKDSTVTRYYACLHALFGFAVIEKKIGDNPARRTDWVRDLVADDDLGDEDHVYLSRGEYRTMRAATPERERALLDALADTGARWSEVTALDVRDVRLAGHTPGVWITKAWKVDEQGKPYRGTTKGRNRRFVPIPSRLVKQLAPVVAGRPGSQLLFRAPRGGRLVHSNWRSRVWLPMVARAARCPDHPPAGAARRVAADELAGPRCGDNGGARSNGRRCGSLVTPGWDRCGLHLDPPLLARSACGCPLRLHQEPTIHDLRHSHVAWLIEAGRPLIVISRRLGHHSVTITERVYAGILPDVDRATAAALDAADDELAAVVSTARPGPRRARRVARMHRRIVSRPRVSAGGSA